MKGLLGWDSSVYLPFGDYIVIFLNDLESLEINARLSYLLATQA
jgi:hypothetical protein